MNRAIYLGWILGTVLCSGLSADVIKTGEEYSDVVCGQDVNVRDVLAFDHHFITMGKNGETISDAKLSPKHYPAGLVPNFRFRQSIIECNLPTGQWRSPRHQVEGAVTDALSTAQLEITFEDGTARQRNFQNYRLLKFNKAPEIECHFIQSDNSPTGLGEPPFAPAGAAIANAIFAATGIRIRELPFKRSGITV